MTPVADSSMLYTSRPWPVVRNAIVTLLQQHREHTVYGSAEVDFTLAQQRISEYRRKTGMAVSPHAFLIHCLALAASEHPEVVTYRRGKNLITFSHIDVGTVIEKLVRGTGRIPVGYIFRSAENQSMACCNMELRQACKSSLEADALVQQRRKMAAYPGIVRSIQAHRIKKDPLLLRRYHGVIGLTNLQVQGLNRPFFAFPTQIYTLTLSAGSLIERLSMGSGGMAVSRKFLCMAAGANHEVIDGMAMAKFARRFTELVETAHGLDERFIQETICLRREREL